MNNQNEKISDIELSLISVISALENKLEELDHNISLISKNNSSSQQNILAENTDNEKIKTIENRISSLKKIIKDKTSEAQIKKYNNTMPSRKILYSSKKGYAAAENLRLKRIENIENTLNDLLKKIKDNPLDSKNISNNVSRNSGHNSYSYEVTPEEFHKNSKRIFFGFIFSISIVFLLLLVVTNPNIFIGFW